MKFSIVTSFYNEPIELIEAVCQSVLSQTYSNFEWVITDDFSQDEITTNFVKSLPERDKRIRYVEQKSKKEVWWNPQTYALGDVVIQVDGDDHIFAKMLEVYHHFYTKYPDVLCMTTDIRNYKNGVYSGSIYINYENYKSHLDYVSSKNDNKVKHGTNTLFTHGYNRSWRNINGLDFKGDLDNRLIIVDYLQLTKLEEMGKLLHIPRVLYGYNTRDVSISRKLDDWNDKSLRTQEIDQSIVERRKEKDVIGIKRIFEQIFLESTAFFDCNVNFDTTPKNVLFATPDELKPIKQEQLRELYFDHNIYFNDYRKDIDYCIVFFDSPQQAKDFVSVYHNIYKYIGRIDVIIQISYKDIDVPEQNNLFDVFKRFLEERHFISWFDFDNHYVTMKIHS